jgi:5-methylcytosine-specific restriction protein A
MLTAEEIESEGLEAMEGGVLLARHLRRERSAGLRRDKPAHVRSRGLPIACGFDFAAVYGERGNGYIEVHHVLPLHVSGDVQPRLQELALLCANCHRMIDRGNWLSPIALRELLTTS